MKYKIKKVKNKIYLADFENHYDLCMFFLRYQEFYESPNPKFRGKTFELLDFMEWYAKDRKGCFTYPVDWGGFNIPSKIISKVHSLGITDRNKYDVEMLHLHRQLEKESRGDYYLIGSSSNDEQTLRHEVAHGMFYTLPNYKKEMIKLVKNLPENTKNNIFNWLKSIGYTKEVFVDEAQAYLATGFSSSFKKPWKKSSKPFVKVYEKFNAE